MWHGHPIPGKHDGTVTMRVHFVIPGDIRERSGGYIYDKEIIRALTRMGCAVMLHLLPDDFPCPDESSVEQCRHLFKKIPDRETVIIDGLIAGAIGALIKENAKRLTIVSLIHLPLAITPWDKQNVKGELLRSERTALSHSHAIVVTSEFAKGTLLQPPYECKKGKIYVIQPGHHTTPRKKTYPELPGRLLCVANVIRRKGYLNLLEALSELRDIDWVLTCCGSLEHETSYVRECRDSIKKYELEDRVILKGTVSGEHLEAEYLGADLFVFPSYYETCGMALTEAAGYGLPIITSVDPATNPYLSNDSTVFFQPHDMETLITILRELMTDRTHYTDLCGVAERYVPETHSWTVSGAKMIEVLNGNRSRNHSGE